MAVATATAARERPGVQRRLTDALFAPIDITLLAYFRMAFGVVMAWFGIAAFQAGYMSISAYANLRVHLNYWPFTFVKPLPQPLLSAAFIVLIVAGLFVALGAYYRAAAIAVFLCQTYFFLMEASRYLNHMYLVCLIAFIMIFLPANRRWSLDVRFDPELRRETVPAWTIWLLRFQVAVPYFLGGVAKLNGDWFRGTALRLILHRQQDFPVIGQFFDIHAVGTFIIWASLLLDFFVVFLLLNRRTRVPAYAAALVFHLMNARFFNIDIFPWTMIAATALFFPPDWPRRLVADARSEPRPWRFWRFVIGFVALGAVAAYLPRSHAPLQVIIGGLGGGLVGYFIDDIWRRTPAPTAVPAAPAPLVDAGPGTPGVAAGQRRLVLWFLGIWVTIQLLVPFRHFLVPGNVYWTELQQHFSWHMMLRNKAGTTTFVVLNPRTGKTVLVDPAELLDETQVHRMTGNPDMTLQVAHFLRDKARKTWHVMPEVRVRTMVSLNFRPPQPIFDPTVDLARIERPILTHQDWILPLQSKKAGRGPAPSKDELDKAAEQTTG